MKWGLLAMAMELSWGRVVELKKSLVSKITTWNVYLTGRKNAMGKSKFKMDLGIKSEMENLKNWCYKYYIYVKSAHFC